MTLGKACAIINGVTGFSDEDTPVGEAWAYITQLLQDTQLLLDLLKVRIAFVNHPGERLTEAGDPDWAYEIQQLELVRKDLRDE